jgi:transposase
MMGIKERAFGPLPPVSLEDLIPADHFYRHLERTLDLAFVRELVRGTYAEIGRPSLDPVVFFKLQLVLFFEGLRSERLLMRVVADRLSLRWYVGYGLGEALPDHSTLTRIRERYGRDVFRRFFEALVEQCAAAGLVWGQELYIDSTAVAANAAVGSLQPRVAVEAHLARLFRAPDGGGESTRLPRPPARRARYARAARPRRGGGGSAAASTRTTSSGCAATTTPTPTQRRCASGRSGWSRSSPRPRTGTGCAASACAGWNGSTSKRS